MTDASRLSTSREPGPYMLHKAGTKRREHLAFEDAQAEAARLLETHPDDTFVITQEVARVTYKENCK